MELVFSSVEGIQYSNYVLFIEINPNGLVHES